MTPFTLVWEAENFDGQQNLRIAQLRRGDIATDVIETLNPVTQWVLYRPQVPDTGKYRLEALYSTDEANPVTVTVNGEPLNGNGVQPRNECAMASRYASRVFWLTSRVA